MTLSKAYLKALFIQGYGKFVSNEEKKNEHMKFNMKWKKMVRDTFVASTEAEGDDAMLWADSALPSWGCVALDSPSTQY